MNLPPLLTSAPFPARMPVTLCSSASDQPPTNPKTQPGRGEGRCLEGSWGTIALSSAVWSYHAWVAYCKPREPPTPNWLVACQVLKYGTRDFQSHYPRASHRFHRLWNDKSKEGKSEIYSHGLVQVCEVTTRPAYCGTPLCLPFPCPSSPHGSLKGQRNGQPHNS